MKQKEETMSDNTLENKKKENESHFLKKFNKAFLLNMPLILLK